MRWAAGGATGGATVWGAVAVFTGRVGLSIICNFTVASPGSVCHLGTESVYWAVTIVSAYIGP